MTESTYNSLNEENKCCPICMEDFEVGNVLKVTPCFHKYHDKCIKDWL